MGGYERQSAPGLPARRDRRPRPHPARLQRPPAEDDWDRFEEIAENSKRRVPAMDEIKVTQLINGPEAFTPDNEFCLGETEVAGLFVAAGFCAHGLAGAGGIGRVMAEWIAEGEPSLDLWEMDVRRFGAQYRSPSYTHARIKETYETYYDIRYPNHERSAGRPLRVSPANAWHREHGRGVRREVGLGAGQLVRVERGARATSRCARGAGPASTGRPRSAPSTRPRARRRGDLRRDLVREDGDRGPGAAELLERLCDNRVAASVGQITYTQMLNRRGGIECDFTVARLAEDRFSIVTGTAFGNHDREWIRRHLPEDGSVQVHDTTSQWACFGIWGPRARDVLQPLTPPDLGNEEFPYMSLREITVGHVPVRALRVTYVGELGWELYCPSEYGLGLWRAIWEEGEPHGIVAGGYRAIDSMRLEKGYRVWGADITPDETPYEGGVGFCVKLDKEGGFIGRDALAEAKDRGPRARLCCLLLADPRSVALGNEPVRIDGEIRGRVTTAATATPSAARSPTPTCPRSTPTRAPRWRSRSSGAGSRARSRASRCSIRRASASGRMRADIAVIGAGVVGSATALELARRGASVALLEAEPEPGLQASGTNSGILHTGFDSIPGELETELILRAAEFRDPVLEALGVPMRALRGADEARRRSATRPRSPT